MNALDRILAQLPKARRLRDGVYRADCPACGGDSHTKFSVKQTDDGVVVHCFGGCPIEDVLQALGMTAGELFDNARQTKPATQAQREDRIRRGMEIWTEQRLTFVCRSLRELEFSISRYVRLLSEHGMDEATWDCLAKVYRLRSDLEWEFHILNRGNLQEIYNALFRARY